MNEKGKNTELQKLTDIMDTLLSPDGCPWDREQTHESLKPYLIEETYETLEALDSGDAASFKEELGDLLLQIVFHCALARRDGRFDMSDVIDSICKKLIRRHPHVFADVDVENSDEVLRNWEAIKNEEKNNQSKGESKKSILDGVPKQMPALLRARRVQEKVSRVGFDWDHVDEAIKKVDEELREFKQAHKSMSAEKTEEELGDLFFAIVNVARFLEANPEQALHKTIAKFIKRFNYIEHKLTEQGKRLGEVSLEEMDKIWDEAKALKRGAKEERNKGTKGR